MLRASGRPLPGRKLGRNRPPPPHQRFLDSPLAVAQVMLEAGIRKVTGANATLNEIADKIKNVTERINKSHKKKELADLDKTTAQPPAKKSRRN